MGDMIEVSFNEVIPLDGMESAFVRHEVEQKCKHQHCKRSIEKIGPTWYHVDGTRKCKQTSAEPEE